MYKRTVIRVILISVTQNEEYALLDLWVVKQFTQNQ